MKTLITLIAVLFTMACTTVTAIATECTDISTRGKRAQVTLTWDAVPGAAEYDVLRADAATGPFVVIEEGLVNDFVTYTDTGLPNGVPLFYRYIAVNVLGDDICMSDVAEGMAIERQRRR